MEESLDLDGCDDSLKFDEKPNDAISKDWSSEVKGISLVVKKYPRRVLGL